MKITLDDILRYYLHGYKDILCRPLGLIKWKTVSQLSETDTYANYSKLSWEILICAGHGYVTANCGNLGPCPHCEAAKGNSAPVKDEFYYGHYSDLVDQAVKTTIEKVTENLPAPKVRVCTCGSSAIGGSGHSSWCDYEPS